jgi:hypothetical protein
MTTYEENLLAARFAALAPEPLAGDWGDVRERAGMARNRRGPFERSQAHPGWRRRLLVALVAVALVAAATTAAWAIVREFILDRGFVGLPPVGALPSAPEPGELVLSFNGRSATLPLDHGKANRSPIGHPMTHVFIYADGRIIWQREGWVPAGANDELSGFLEQRLTAEGVELLRSQVLSTGLFGKDLALVSGEQGWGAIQARSHGRLVTLRWIWADQQGPTNPFPGDLRNYRFRAATPEQDRALLRLDALLGDPAASLPASAWHDRRIRAYVPSRYAVCWQHRPEQGPDNPPPSIAPERILPLLPTAVADLLRRRGVVPWHDADIPSRACSIVPTAEARSVAQALDDAGFEEGVVGNRIDASLGGLTYRLEAPAGRPGHVYVWFEPTLPHGGWVGTGG